MEQSIGKLTLITSTILVILGFIDLSFYYSNFHIPINHYLNPGEIILAFSQLNTFSLIFIFKTIQN